MKKMIRTLALFSLIAVMALTAACTGSSTKAEPTYVTGTDSEDAPSAQAQTDVAETTANTAADSSTDYKAELIGQWKLSAVYKDGEQQSIAAQYGSVIRQTGAYIEFKDDDTFQCVLGLPGCKGTYSIENGEVTLHITTKYDGKTDAGNACDENETLKWDHEARTLSFDFNGVTNEFSK